MGGGGEGAPGEPEAKAEPKEGCHDAVSPPSIVSFPGSGHTFIVLGEYGGLRRCSWRPGYPRLLRVEVTSVMSTQPFLLSCRLPGHNLAF